MVEFEEIKIKKKNPEYPIQFEMYGTVCKYVMLCLLLQDTAAVFIYFFRSGYLS